MNKSAVALAADSAVTISSGRGGIKTYETINKLFELIRGSSVGLMIYSNAEINGMPWETVVKSYRAERTGFSAPYVEDYVEDFQRFLSSADALLPASSDVSLVLQTTYDHLLKLFRMILDNESAWVTSAGRVVKSRLLAVFREGLEALEASMASADLAPWSSELSVQRLDAEYGDAIAALIDELFGRFSISRTDRRRVRAWAIDSLRKCLSEPAETGLVIAGFGDRDYLPKLYSSRVRGRLSGVLRVAHPKMEEITIGRPGHFDTFAQDEQARGFLSGISSEVRRSVMRHWSDWAGSVRAESRRSLRKRFPRLSAATVDAISAELSSLAKGAVSEFAAAMGEREYTLYIKPMLDSIASLPKDELGLLAESLVSITSLKQRMSIYDHQTVGGPIDVALLSRGDGFVWLRRKHYFSSQLNPAWHLTHHAIIDSRRSNMEDGDGHREGQD